MAIVHKMLVNAFVFFLVALYLGYRELYVMHPDAIDMFNITIQM